MSIITISGQQELVPCVHPTFCEWSACFVLYIKLAFWSNIGLCIYILVDSDHSWGLFCSAFGTPLLYCLIMCFAMMCEMFTLWSVALCSCSKSRGSVMCCIVQLFEVTWFSHVYLGRAVLPCKHVAASVLCTVTYTKVIPSIANHGM